MYEFLNQLSKGTIAALAIGGGIFFLLIYDPPHNICHTQVGDLKAKQEKTLFVSSKRKKQSRGSAISVFEERRMDCRATNRAGGCYEFFSQLRKLLFQLRGITEDCREDVADIDEVDEALWGGMEILTELSWGGAPPASLGERYSWLDTSDITLYCDLKRVLSLYYPKSRWEDFRERMFTDLPGAGNLPREQAWEKMLLSTNCAQYP